MTLTVQDTFRPEWSGQIRLLSPNKIADGFLFWAYCSAEAKKMSNRGCISLLIGFASRALAALFGVMQLTSWSIGGETVRMQARKVVFLRRCGEMVRVRCVESRQVGKHPSHTWSRARSNTQDQCIATKPTVERPYPCAHLSLATLQLHHDHSC